MEYTDVKEILKEVKNTLQLVKSEVSRLCKDFNFKVELGRSDILMDGKTIDIIIGYKGWNEDSNESDEDCHLKEMNQFLRLNKNWNLNRTSFNSTDDIRFDYIDGVYLDRGVGHSNLPLYANEIYGEDVDFNLYIIIQNDNWNIPNGLKDLNEDWHLKLDKELRELFKKETKW